MSVFNLKQTLRKRPLLQRNVSAYLRRIYIPCGQKAINRLSIYTLPKNLIIQIKFPAY